MKISDEQLKLTANTIRGLVMDMVEKAKSGHPGMPMGMADVATVLFLNHLIFNPEDPRWINRDRFILSAGHGSALLYSFLHLAGYNISLEDLKLFRQTDSKTAGHPEVNHNLGIEVTTGPLGQGLGNAVGMAMAERILAGTFNTDIYNIIDHYIYVIASDGDMMEGISHEALSLAGHLKLNKLIIFYDYNKVTIDGPISLTYSDNVRLRFKAYGWNVLEINGHNYTEIEKAIRKAKRSQDNPTLIICHTHIAYGSPHMQDTSESHGAPLGEEEVKATKKNLGLPPEELFYIPEEVKKIFEQRKISLKRCYTKWQRIFKGWAETYPEKYEELKRRIEDRLPEDLEKDRPSFDISKQISTRQASSTIIQLLAKKISWLIGGSADLASSNRTRIENGGDISAGNFTARNINFGVREHGMAAILNGIMLYGGFRVFGATFEVFSDYCRPSIRLAAMMKLPVIYVFTHDSFCVGEDGPTHQPVEQHIALRCIPGITVIRPADATETFDAWIAALKNKSGPTVILLTRQNIPVVDRSQYPPSSLLHKGAYIMKQTSGGDPDLIIIATGSEVHIACEACELLKPYGTIRVVNMPSWELFEKQTEDYKESILPSSCNKRIVIEAGVRIGWERYAGKNGIIIAMQSFGTSGPYKELMKKFGFTPQNIVECAKTLLNIK